jgi:pectate lyase
MSLKINLGLMMLLLAINVNAATNRPDGFKTISQTASTGTDNCNTSPSTEVTLSAAGGDDRIDLSWTATDNIASIQVTRNTDANPSGRQRVATLPGSARSYTDNTVVNGRQYWYWIKYTDTGKNSGSSNAGNATANASTPADTYNGSQLTCLAANTVQGFAGIDSETTGGNGGTRITVTTGAELVTALANQKNNSAPLKIFVKGTITEANSGGAVQFDVKNMANVSILGVGDNALLDGIGINIADSSNIIVRNLTVRFNRIGQKDGISIQGNSHNIWVDHNEIYNSLNVDKDYYDELVSGKDESDKITISYNYLHDSWKTSLWGSSDSDSFDRRVTFLGNHWENVNSRLPLFRFGQAHVVNNYYHKVVETGINARMGARIRVEANHFEEVNNPIVSFYSDNIGYWDAVDNIFENITWKEDAGVGIIAGPQVESTVTYLPPYYYSPVPVVNVKDHVLKNAGVGKLNGCL